MALGRTCAIALNGLDGAVVHVEADIGGGLPTFLIGGLPDAACKQSADRIRSAAAHSGMELPRHRIVVNLSPASLPKTGSVFDLSIAIAALAADRRVPTQEVARVVHLGELGLDGTVRAVHGVLPLVLAAVRAGLTRVVVPAGNAREAALVPGADVVPAHSLRHVVEVHQAAEDGRPAPAATWRGPDEEPCPPEAPVADGAASRVAVGGAETPRADGQGDGDQRAAGVPDLRDVVGQGEARLALEIAAAGGHHLLMIGPPGAGKTMLAERLPSLLPELSVDQAMETTAVHSILGVLPPGVLVRRPPFVAPHHGASLVAVVGGGSGSIRPGLISQAHRGVLFLDEAPEFRPQVLQALRQPLESGQVVLARARASVRYPCRFQLVLAANPCPCGQGYGKGTRCRCSPRARRDYLGRLAGPLLDRVDLQLQVPAVSLAGLAGGPGEDSAAVAARVAAARAVQKQRYEGEPWTLNAHLPGSRVRRGPHAVPVRARVDLDRALDRGTLTLRGFDRVLRIACTVRDLAGGDEVTRDDVGLALTLRAHGGAAA